jgi:hypothetical protein
MDRPFSSTHKAVKQAARATGWRIIAIFLGAAAFTLLVVLGATFVWKGGQVVTITRSHLLLGNETTWFDYTYVDRIGVRRLCFANSTYVSPDCLFYDGTSQCVTAPGATCLGDVMIRGRLQMAEGGSFDAIAFNAFSMGNLTCTLAEDGHTIACDGGTWYPGAIGVPVLIKDEEGNTIASLRSNGTSLVVNGSGLQLSAPITGTATFTGNAIYQQRLILGPGSNNSVLQRGADGQQVLGNPSTEFLDDVKVDGDFAVAGSVTQALTFASGADILLDGTHSYVTQREGDLDVCSTTGALRLCGLTVDIAGTNSISLSGPVTGETTFEDNVHFVRTAFFTNVTVTNNLNLNNVVILGTERVEGPATFVSTVNVTDKVTAYNLDVAVNTNLMYVTVGSATDGTLATGAGTVTTIGGALIVDNGVVITEAGNASRFYSAAPTFSVRAHDGLSLESSNGWFNASATQGMCIGTREPFANNPSEHCTMYIDSTGCANFSCMYVQDLVFSQADVTRLRVRDEVCLLRIGTNDSWPGVERCGLYANTTSTSVYVQSLKVTRDAQWTNGAGTPVFTVHSDGTGLTFDGTVNVTYFSDDTALAGDSSNALPTEHAVKQYVDNKFDELGHEVSGDIGGIWSGTQGITFRYNRVGNVVFASFIATSYSATTSGTTLLTTAAIVPEAIRPQNDRVTLITIQNNSAFEVGELLIRADGYLQVGRLGMQAFTASGNSGIRGGEITWRILTLAVI